MRVKRRIVIVLFAALLIVLPLASCSKSSSPSSMSAERIKELGEEFRDELDNIYIPIRENDERLLEQEAVLMLDDKTHYISRLYDFYEDYKVGETTEIVTVFKSKSFVVTKVVFEGDKGCYFRYQFDPFKENEIVISSQPLDKVEITKDEKLKKVELTLLKEKQTPIVFSYKNIDEEE